jgi:site-specific DNA-methyltransferase (adenine-specific)
MNEIVVEAADVCGVVLNECCIEGMKKISSESVDIIICDPPYNIGKDFGNNCWNVDTDEYLLWCDQWIEQCVRILKPTGTLYIYGFSEILAYIRVRIKINVRWIVWHYTNKVTPSLNFWQRTHESILVCSKNKRPNFNRDDVREPYTKAFLKNAAGKVRKATKGRFSDGKKETIYKAHSGGALPRDVIKISALAGGAGRKERVNHPTQKPLALCEKLIKAAMNKGAADGAEGAADGAAEGAADGAAEGAAEGAVEKTFLVVPFAGSGSECVAANNLNVSFIGYEINSEYVELCNQRLNNI